MPVQGRTDEWALAAAVAPLGVAYGVAACAAGGGVARPVVASFVVLAGGSQFAALGVAEAGGSSWDAAFTGALLNLRFVPLGATIAAGVKGGPLKRAFQSHLVGDHTVGVALRHPLADQGRAFVRLGLVVWAVWVAATLVGSLVGTVVDPASLGVDAAIAASFAALALPCLGQRSGRTTVAVSSGVAATLALIGVATSLVVLGAGVLGALAGASVRPKDRP